MGDRPTTGKDFAVIQETIIEKIAEIETSRNVRVLHAVESGSRAWGFSSPDSDYDVRFIYVRQAEEYLKLNPGRDVIEWQLDETLDINGWDLQKTLILLHKSNPTLFEWSNSPIVYKTTPEWGRIAGISPKYFLSKPGMYHYLSMAGRNYREYLKGEFVPVKKYLYVLRPILACKWILAFGTPPPMQFSELVKSRLEPEMLPVIERLLEIKTGSPETKRLPQMKEINDYIERVLPELEAQASLAPGEKKQGFDELNEVFLSILRV